MSYTLLIIFLAASAEIGEKRLKVFLSLSIPSSNIVLGLILPSPREFPNVSLYAGHGIRCH